ncbi:hypothetical protein ACRCD8_06625 [Aliarcobacter sp. ERUVET-8]|uniref:hypothetical protein n=1 Tax=Aliarcobacter sp. ERUVET-8 TaxID=3429684 RepID=UPI003D6BFDAF
MISPIQTGKTYGVLHTESFFSFLGFAKKVGSDKTQKIDVFLDDKLIDTIEANEFIQKIDDMYDVESKAFTYNLQIKYIGQKSTISFKNHDSGEELLNSPYTLIDKNHEDFNEAKFLHSLSEPLSEELKNTYKPNCVGFLATKENLENEEFMRYIKELIGRFPDVEFNGFCLNTKEMIELKELFKNSINLKYISTIQELINETKTFIYLPNSNIQNTIVSYISSFIICTYLDFSIKDSIKDYEERFKDYFSVFFNNIEKFGFTQENIIEYDNSCLCLIFNYFIKLNKLNCKFINFNDSYQTIYFKKVELIFSSNDFQSYLRKITNFLNQLNKNN